MASTINLSFDYTMWSCCINEDQMTESKAKMKKIIADDIKNTLIKGYKKHDYPKESPLKLSIPFHYPRSVTNDMDIKINFAKSCKFKCEKFSGCLKTRTEFGEISVDGKIFVTLSWTY